MDGNIFGVKKSNLYYKLKKEIERLFTTCSTLIASDYTLNILTLLSDYTLSISGTHVSDKDITDRFRMMRCRSFQIHTPNKVVIMPGLNNSIDLWNFL